MLNVTTVHFGSERLSAMGVRELKVGPGFERYCLTAVAIWYRFEKRSWRHYFSTSEKQGLSLHSEKLVFLWFFESYVRPGFERYCLTAVTIWYGFEKISWRHYFSTTEKQGLSLHNPLGCLKSHPNLKILLCYHKLNPTLMKHTIFAIFWKVVTPYSTP